MRRGWQQASARTTAAKRTVGAVVRRHQPDYKIGLYMGLLMLFGLIVMYAIGPQRANFLNVVEGTNFSETYFFMKQAFSLMLAVGAFIVASKLPYRFISRYAGKLLLVGFGACALLMVLGDVFNMQQVALCTKGACRWFIIPGLGTFQPAELLKFGILIFTAGFLGMRVRQGLVNDRDKTLYPLGIMTLAAAFFVIFMQRDMGTGISLLAILMTMLVMSGMSWRIIGMVSGALLLGGVLLIITAPHRIERVMTFFQGDSASVDDEGGYHIAHAKIAIGTGGLLGLGVGKSVQASGYLPESVNDSVFAIIGETFGLVGLVGVLALFLLLLMRLLRVSDHLTDPRQRLLVAGVFGWLASHVVLNVAAMLGLVPLTGITLPLLSSGGTSMLYMGAALGLAFQLSRYTTFGSTLVDNDTTTKEPGWSKRSAPAAGRRTRRS